MAVAENEILLTIHLKHDQSKNLAVSQPILAERAWWENFPPPGIEIVSWYVVMGIGQVVTLKLPANRLAEVNVALERMAWGVFTTDFYPTYDFVPVRERLKREYLAAKAKQ
jgi:hypothetical protein